MVTRPDWLDAELFPFQSRFQRLRGGWLHYVDHGPGDSPVLLMLHGNPTWSFLYRDVIQALSSRFRCIAADYPGFGLSRAPPGYAYTPREHAAAVAELVAALDLRDVTLLVHDWGGPIGLWAATREPERYSRLVITNSWAWPVTGDRRLERFSALAGGALGRLLTRRLNLFVNAGLRLGTASRLPRRVMRAYRGPFPDAASREAVAVLPGQIVRSADFLGEVSMGLERLRDRPTLIVWGARDPAFRSEHRARFERYFPRHRTQILQHAGHFVAEDAAGELSRAVWNWHGAPRRGVSAASR